MLCTVCVCVCRTRERACLNHVLESIVKGRKGEVGGTSWAVRLADREKP